MREEDGIRIKEDGKRRRTDDDGGRWKKQKGSCRNTEDGRWRTNENGREMGKSEEGRKSGM